LINQQEQIAPILARHGLYFNQLNMTQENRSINDFITQKNAPSQWSNNMNESLDALERSIRSF
jgi:hypothetical protein